MASSGSQNSGQNFFGAISIPATSLGNITITSCSTGVKYKLYPVECFSPPQKSRGYPMGIFHPRRWLLSLISILSQENFLVKLLLAKVR